ncbi:MAG: radical SAM protein [Gammaproteobacteria bacterium]|nr:radical SAM protein [Gammaproteobacteria bacterium]MCF6261626.1 radical SAM protein [Gammaproteobacteria bacterium]
MSDSPAEKKFIHLLYAPTNFCNMACQYCYLGDGTDVVTDTKKALNTLQYAIDQFLSEDIIPFNLSFHGGEPTAVPEALLNSLFSYASEYYQQYGAQIQAAGFPLNPVHIKTNLYNFDHLYELFDQYRISVSGSIDLPLRLHDKYRTDKKGRSTLKPIMKNLKLLADYPHHKKISCVVTQEHMQHLDEMIADIKTIHYDIGLDMTKFNIMFSFDSTKNKEKFSEHIAGTEMLSQQQQLELYETLKKAFTGTELEHGLMTHWFKEFTPEFCCSAVNCGDKFFLLQSNGDVYSCPRGQSSDYFLYGNIFRQPITEIVSNGWQAIEALENKLDADEGCFSCEYLPYCNQGCVFVREQTGLKKSYTCQLQKAIYRDHPDKYPPYENDYIKDYSLKYRYRNNLKSFSPEETEPLNSRYITPELFEDRNSLAAFIEKDVILQTIYSNELINILIDGVAYPLRSPILSNRNELTIISENSKVILCVPDHIFSVNCNDPVNNYLQIMILRNTMVQYGDENREKQEHIADYCLYKNSFQSMSQNNQGMLEFDLTDFLHAHKSLFLNDVRNNLYVTTKTLREYHYKKQNKNAFYHLQAINLPFSFIEFYWD